MVIQLPKLPPPALPCRSMAGPTPWCNWAIPGTVIAGAYPASVDDAETRSILTTLLELGITTFVCLQAEVNINISDHTWKSGRGLRPYIKDAQRILSSAHERQHSRIKQEKIDFLHLPIIDGSVTTDTAMHRLAEDCCARVLRGEKLYVHCWGGHGRTGTLISVMLGRLYGLSQSEALRYCQIFHDSRTYPQGVRSPQTPIQRAQVRRLFSVATNIAAQPMEAQALAGREAELVRPTAFPSKYSSVSNPLATTHRRSTTDIHSPGSLSMSTSTQARRDADRSSGLLARYY